MRTKGNMVIYNSGAEFSLLMDIANKGKARIRCIVADILLLLIIFAFAIFGTQWSGWVFSILIGCTSIMTLRILLRLRARKAAGFFKRTRS